MSPIQFWLGFISFLVISAHTIPTAYGQKLVPAAARQGYYIGANLRAGVSTGEADNIGDLGTFNRSGFGFRLGQKTLPWLGLGINAEFDGLTNDNWSISNGKLMLEVQIEPLPINLALKGSVGAGGGSISRTDTDLETDDDPSFMFGSVYALGISYEWFPFYKKETYNSGGLGISAFAEGRFFPAGDVTLSGILIGIELTWWTGLDRRKLALPVEEAFK